jgi:hypothetical protein
VGVAAVPALQATSAMANTSITSMRIIGVIFLI